MKLYHFSAAFSIIFLAITRLISWRESCADYFGREKDIMEAGMERAVDTAAGQLAVYCDGTLRIDCGRVLDSFLSTLYAGLGVLEYEALRKQALDRITLFLIAAEEEIYIWMPAERERVDRNQREETEEWKEKPDTKQNQTKPGKKSSMENLNANWDGKNPEENRDMGNQNYDQSQGSWNRILLPAGVSKEERSKLLEQILNSVSADSRKDGADTKFIFQLPYQDACLWLRGAEEPCVMALWHGRPYMLEGKEYLRFFFSGAVVHKRK